MAIAVMAVITILNIVLLLVVLRLGTQEDSHSQLAAEDSAAVLAWRARVEQRSQEAPRDPYAPVHDS